MGDVKNRQKSLCTKLKNPFVSLFLLTRGNDIEIKVGKGEKKFYVFFLVCVIQGRFRFFGREELDRERVTILQKVDVKLELQENINCKAVRTK